LRKGELNLRGRATKTLKGEKVAIAGTKKGIAKKKKKRYEEDGLIEKDERKWSPLGETGRI